MGLDATVCVGTYGEPTWIDTAQRAIDSARPQAPTVAHCHRATLAEARNTALEGVRTEWVTFLDADDELEEGYVEAMSRGTADVRGPMIRFMRGEKERNLWQPRVHAHSHDCVAECITSGEGNWLPAGTVAKTELVREAGGWREWPVYEDFDLWMRVLMLGASVELIRDAIYRAEVRDDSRNRAPEMAVKNRVHREIVKANLGELAEAA